MLKSNSSGLERLPGQLLIDGNEVIVGTPAGNLRGYIIEGSSGRIILVDNKGEFHEVRLEPFRFHGAMVRTPVRFDLPEPLYLLKLRWYLKQAQENLEQAQSRLTRAAADPNKSDETIRNLQSDRETAQYRVDTILQSIRKELQRR